jgi:leader peptidase (prepilin peptidase)/N-methyltransferase
VYRDQPGVESAAIGAGGAFLLIQVLFVWTYEALLGRRGMGEGDSKLLMMIGAFLGWQGAGFALFAGAGQGLVGAVAGLITRRLRPPEAETETETETETEAETEAETETDEDDEPPPKWVGHLKLPFGPFLALAALEYLFFGDVLTDAWLELIGNGLRWPWS